MFDSATVQHRPGGSTIVLHTCQTSACLLQLFIPVTPMHSCHTFAYLPHPLHTYNTFAYLSHLCIPVTPLYTFHTTQGSTLRLARWPVSTNLFGLSTKSTLEVAQPVQCIIANLLALPVKSGNG